MDRVGIGIIGGGNVSQQYLKAVGTFPILDVRAIADANPEVATARGAEFNVPVKSVADLLADPAVEIVVNLTIPKAHVEVGLAAVAAGKHVHSEKPLGISVAEARRLIDEGEIGTPVAGTAFFMGPGHERWHPNPGFYYLEGGGPVLDMAPYYLTDLVNLLGPVKRVAAVTSRTRKERVITSEPLKGTMMPVEVDTHAAGTLEFVAGSVVTVVVSFDVPHHGHRPIEIYGTEASIAVPDPNWFGGDIEMATAKEGWQKVATQHPYTDANYRSIGVADMAYAIRENRPHRVSGDLAFHVLEVMEAFQRSSESGRHIMIESRPERPAMLPVNLAAGELD